MQYHAFYYTHVIPNYRFVITLLKRATCQPWKTFSKISYKNRYGIIKTSSSLHEAAKKVNFSLESKKCIYN